MTSRPVDAQAPKERQVEALSCWEPDSNLGCTARGRPCWVGRCRISSRNCHHPPASCEGRAQRLMEELYVPYRRLSCDPAAPTILCKAMFGFARRTCTAKISCRPDSLLGPCKTPERHTPDTRELSWSRRSFRPPMRSSRLEAVKKLANVHIQLLLRMLLIYTVES
jgi:hypothetical protein